MYQRTPRLVALCALMAISLDGTVVAAQTEFSAPNQAAQLPTEELPEQCRDIYPNFAVNAVLRTPVADLVSGTTMDVTTTLTNKTAYPVANGVLYAQVYQLENSEGDVGNATLVDQFVAVSDIALEPNGTTSETFRWSVPTWLPTGSYIVSTAVMDDDAHSLAGSPLWARAPGNTLRFTVTNEDAARTNTFAIASDALAVNGQKLARSPELPLVDSNTAARVTVPVTNNTTDEQSVQVTWRLYAYNQTTQKHELSSQQERVVLEANERLVLERDFSVQNQGVYVAVAEIATTLGERYIANLPFAASDTFDPYIKFAVLDGKTTDAVPYLYACLDKHGGTVAGENVSLDVTLETPQQRLALVEQQSVTLAESAVLQTVPLTDISFTRATATLSLSNEGQVIEQRNFPVVCRGGSCMSGTGSETDSSDSTAPVNTLLYLIGASVLAVVLLGLLFSAPLLRRLFKSSNANYDNQA